VIFSADFRHARRNSMLICNQKSRRRNEGAGTVSVIQANCGKAKIPGEGVGNIGRTLLSPAGSNRCFRTLIPKPDTVIGLRSKRDEADDQQAGDGAELQQAMS
jgi:hypothetical protein